MKHSTRQSANSISPSLLPGGVHRFSKFVLITASLVMGTALSARADFPPGSGGSIPDIPPLVGIPNQIGGLRVYRSHRENNFFGSGTRAILDLYFDAPETNSATGYRLQRSLNGTTSWEDQPWNYGVMETSSATQQEFSFNPDGFYYYRLLVLGGPKNGWVSNMISAPLSGVDTRFAGWGMDQSMSITGVMWPYVGFGIEASVIVRKLSDDSNVSGGLTYQWYRLNPLSSEMTLIEGATGLTYATTIDDVGGYQLLFQATGDGTTVGGLLQLASGGPKIPNNSFASNLTADGFRLNLYKSVPSLAVENLELTCYTATGSSILPITSLTPLAGNASFDIGVSIPADAQSIYLTNTSHVWDLVSEMGGMQGHYMPGLNITIPTGGFVPEIAIQQPTETDIADGGSKSFPNTNVGSNTSLTFTIQNTGSANLTGLTITKDGTNAPDFTVTANPLAPVIPGGSTTFTVQFAPSAAGTRTAAIHIASNDADENPYDITLTGLGIGIPEIAVQQPAGTNIADGGTKVFTNTTVGTNSSLVFTIRNTGSANLTGLTITKDGMNASDFTITANPTAPVIAGAATTFTVRFAPTATGSRTATIHIASNDADENPYDITLKGWGIGGTPEIAVQQPAGTNIADGGSKAFANTTVGTNRSLVFTIRNTGTGNLTGLTITKNGANASDFTITANPVAPVIAGGTTTFTVRFAPTTNGSKTAAIHIASNDADENPYDIMLTGWGIGGIPEIAVQQPAGTNIADGGTKAFANTTVGTNRSLVFTIKNLGTGNLTGLTITKNGSNASDFTITTNPLAPVIAGAATTFTVRFAPTTKGAKAAAIHIASNDANENPYDITLTGWGLAAAPGIADDSENLPGLAAGEQSRDRSKTVITVDPEDGLKYRTLLVTKAPGTARQRRIVEVSPNLLDWYSGGNHTTVLRNDASILKVRDNTPVTPGVKRYIRLKPTRN